MDYSLLIEALLAILLCVFLYYAVVLNRRLGSLRDSKGELEKVISTFAEATGRADKSIQGFRANAEQSGRALQETMDRAQTLRDDLAFMIDKADSLADRLDGAIRNARSAGGVSIKDEPAAALGAAAAPLIKEDDVPVQAPVTKPSDLLDEDAPSADDIVAEPKGEKAKALEDAVGKKKRPQSKAEQELLKALQSMR